MAKYHKVPIQGSFSSCFDLHGCAYIALLCIQENILLTRRINDLFNAVIHASFAFWYCHHHYQVLASKMQILERKISMYILLKINLK